MYLARKPVSQLDFGPLSEKKLCTPAQIALQDIRSHLLWLNKVKFKDVFFTYFFNLTFQICSWMSRTFFSRPRRWAAGPQSDLWVHLILFIWHWLVSQPNLWFLLNSPFWVLMELGPGEACITNVCGVPVRKWNITDEQMLRITLWFLVFTLQVWRGSYLSY